jgi:hypothetical protein
MFIGQYQLRKRKTPRTKMHQKRYSYGWTTKMTLPRGVAKPTELSKHLNALAPLPLGVVNLRYTVDDDWSGDPAIFFWITLSDDAARQAVLAQTSRRIMDFITQRLDPIGEMGSNSIFQFSEPIRAGKPQGKGFRLIEWPIMRTCLSTQFSCLN